jgi:hypothetical protein
LSHVALARGASNASLILTAAMAIACGKADRIEITESRPRHVSEKKPQLDVPYDQSFPSSERYRWKLPAGWIERPPDQFRRTNLAFGPSLEGECYVSIVNGSDIDNLNRWRMQMGQRPLTDEEVATLPHKDLFGRPAAVVDITGTYSGAGGATPKSNWRLVGAVQAAADGTVTVKMTGPPELVAKELPNFDAFLASLRLTRYSSQ